MMLSKHSGQVYACTALRHSSRNIDEEALSSLIAAFSFYPDRGDPPSMNSTPTPSTRET